MAEEAPELGSDEYNQLMAEKFKNPGDEPDEDLLPLQEMPADGMEKYYDNDTGTYNWEAHARELLFNANGRPKTQEEKTKDAEKASEEPSPEAEEQEVSNILVKAGLDTEEIGQKIIDDGDLSAEDYEALKKVGIPEKLLWNTLVAKSSGLRLCGGLTKTYLKKRLRISTAFYQRLRGAWQRMV